MAYSNIDKPSKYFNTVTYTGTGASLANTGVGFQPDWVWIKGRSGATDHGLYDAVRGVQKQLESNTTTAETTETTGLTAFGTDGFTVGALAQLNTSSATYVAWNWLGANTTVSNTAGTITSTVSANTTSGFSIVSYTGTGANATVGHGLGSTPKVVIVKRRSAIDDWYVNHTSASATAGSYLKLNNTQAVITGSATRWNNTNPTSTLFTIGTDAGLNASGGTYIAYCFADVKGYSKFGSYTGNGSTDGTFVYTGFKPRWIMVKSTGDTGGWTIMDTSRIGYNASNYTLYAEATTAEQGYLPIDILSNGFKLRIVSTGTSFNSNTINYIYMAFAENPFVSSKGLPCTAR